jgi:hypothetical protein
MDVRRVTNGGERYWILAALFSTLTLCVHAEVPSKKDILCKRNPNALVAVLPGTDQSAGVHVQALLQYLNDVCFSNFDEQFRDVDDAFLVIKLKSDKELTLDDEQRALSAMQRPVQVLKVKIAQNHPVPTSVDDGAVRPVARVLSSELDGTLSALALGSDPRDPHLQKTYWEYAPANELEASDTGDRIGLSRNGIAANPLSQVKLRQYLLTGCAPAGAEKPATVSAACESRYYEIYDTFYVTSAMQALIGRAGAVVARMAMSDLKRNRAEWNYYFEEARVMYPWELTAQFESIMKAHDPNRGFLRAPTEQTFWLHPSVAMESVIGAPDGDRLQPALVLELYGKNWWSFKSYDDTKDRLTLDGWAKGFSVIATYSDVADVHNWGVGLSAHINQAYTVSTTYHGADDWAVLFNLNVIELYKNSWKPTIDELKQKVNDYR